MLPRSAPGQPRPLTLTVTRGVGKTVVLDQARTLAAKKYSWLSAAVEVQPPARSVLPALHTTIAQVGRVYAPHPPQPGRWKLTTTTLKAGVAGFGAEAEITRTAILRPVCTRPAGTTPAPRSRTASARLPNVRPTFSTRPDSADVQHPTGADVAGALNQPAQALSYLRERLLKKGTIYTEGRALRLAVPSMAGWILNQQQ